MQLRVDKKDSHPLNTDGLTVHSEPGKSSVNGSSYILIPVSPPHTSPNPHQRQHEIKQTQQFVRWPRDTRVYFGRSKIHDLRMGSPEMDPVATTGVQEVSLGGTESTTSTRWAGNERGKGEKPTKVLWQASYHWGVAGASTHGETGKQYKILILRWSYLRSKLTNLWLRTAPWNSE